MKIGNIDYFVLLMVGDLSEDGPEYHFNDFEEFNAFVRQNKDNPLFQNTTLNYTLVENVDGKPDHFMWSQEIAFKEFTKEEIAHEIEAQLEFLEDATALSSDFAKKEIRYQAPAGNGEQKKHRLQDFTYVCPYCVREIEDCQCEHYPYFLIQVDTLMVPIIRELNALGYKTTGCCAGHPEQGAGYTNIYVAFDKEYDFSEPLPEGAQWSKLKHCISFEAPVQGYEELVEFQQQTLDKLSDWAETLSDQE